MTPNQGVHLRVELLGRLDVRTESDREIRLTGRHAQALFGLLVLVRRPRSRETIAADLWPEAEANTAGSMRQALWLVRQALVSVGISPTDLLDIEGDTVGIRMDAEIDLDTAALERCLDATGCGPEEAISRYRGDLLEGLGHDCFASERERLADRYEDALAVVAEQRLEAGDLDGARIAATRLLARDPLREEAHAVLIAVHGQIGSRSQVVRQYRRLSDVLSRELGERPLPGHRGDLPSCPRPDDASRAGASRAHRAEPSTAAGRRRPLTSRYAVDSAEPLRDRSVLPVGRTMPPETCLMTIGRRITCFAVILLVAGCSASGGGGATAGATERRAAERCAKRDRRRRRALRRALAERRRVRRDRRAPGRSACLRRRSRRSSSTRRGERESRPIR